MENRAACFFDKLRGKRLTFIGIGVSHTDVIRMLAAKGCRITVRDKRSRDKIGPLCDELEALGVSFILGEDYLKNLSGDVIFRTPGMKYDTPELIKAKEEGAVITSEMEMFFDLCPCKIFGITGSDGKTTSTTIIAEMLKVEGYTVHLGGNIGKALLPVVEQVKPDDMAVVELSSFQLISMRRSPDIALVTNLAPNHLDMHKDMQEYIDAKKNLILHQNAFSRAVLNQDNEITAGFQSLARGECLFFSRQKPVKKGAFLDEDGMLCMAHKDGTTKIIKAEEIRIPGVHNVENFLGAIAAVWGYVSVDTIRKVAREFGGVEHRIEFVRELDGVKWYNDSIATSPTRTIAGLNSFSQKMIIIAGGYDKKIPFLPLAPKIIEKVKVLILTGATAQKIEDTVTSYAGYNPRELTILHAGDMADAVRLAREYAKAGDVVSLSPASASFDCYPNFEARGRHFKELVNAL